MLDQILGAHLTLLVGQGVPRPAGLAVMEEVNPMRTPSGRAEHGRYTVRWSSEPIEAPRASVSRDGSPGAFRMGLYRCRIRVAAAGAEPVEFSVRRAGYRPRSAIDALGR